MACARGGRGKLVSELAVVVASPHINFLLRQMLLAAELLRLCRYPPRFSTSLVPEYVRNHTKKGPNLLINRSFTQLSPLNDTASTSTASPRRGRPPKVPKAEDAKMTAKRKRGRKSAIESADDPFSDEGTFFLS